MAVQLGVVESVLTEYKVSFPYSESIEDEVRARYVAGPTDGPGGWYVGYDGDASTADSSEIEGLYNQERILEVSSVLSAMLGAAETMGTDDESVASYTRIADKLLQITGARVLVNPEDVHAAENQQTDAAEVARRRVAGHVVAAAIENTVYVKVLHALDERKVDFSLSVEDASRFAAELEETGSRLEGRGHSLDTLRSYVVGNPEASGSYGRARKKDEFAMKLTKILLGHRDAIEATGFDPDDPIYDSPIGVRHNAIREALTEQGVIIGYSQEEGEALLAQERKDDEHSAATGDIVAELALEYGYGSSEYNSSRLSAMARSMIAEELFTFIPGAKAQ